MKKRLVLVGLGNMGRNWLRVIRASDAFDLVAIVDPIAPAVPGPPMLRSVDELDGLEFDAAIVATPTATHFAIAYDLLVQGKAVLVEKPIAATASEARALGAAATLGRAPLVVGHVERFNPAIRKLGEVIFTQAAIGVPIHFSVTRVGGYPANVDAASNVLLDLAVHDLDILRCILGPLRIEGAITHSTRVEGLCDTAEILLSSRKGASAAVHVNWTTPIKIRHIRVTGTKAVAFVDLVARTCTVVSSPRPGAPEDRIEFGIERVEPLASELAAFAASLEPGALGETGLCSAEDATAAVLLAESAIAGRIHGEWI